MIDGEKQALNEYLPMSWDEMGEKYVPFTTDPVTGYAIKDTAASSISRRRGCPLG